MVYVVFLNLPFNRLVFPMAHPSRSILRGISLPETIIAITLLSTLLVMTLQMMGQFSNAWRRMEMQETLAEQSWRMLEKITETVRVSYLDYEEYYSRYGVQAGVVSNQRTFGENYGIYHQQFFNPSTHYETGTHPYQGNPSGANPADANSLCPLGGPNPDCPGGATLGMVNELFLINAEGTRRTYFVIEYNTLAKVELLGSDTDQDSLIDTWACAPEYTCTGLATTTGVLPNPADLTDGIADDINFVRLSPLNIVIEDITFWISPLEDPYKGFNESTEQTQPKVKILLDTVYQLIDQSGTPVPTTTTNLYGGPAASMHLQSTVSTGVFTSTPTYEP